ncbi:nitroreductase [Bombilactobacillus thymidiniphilus]|uniref:Nitroreductase n=1 Tax=Bombilactobacillus thymidiniphilus TaxID=2923363 RepID=A0ABY4PBI5_9LACO|nr:nitroreductase [Bombilactobacillus thymidiniphilus]UQS82975.1 nitroreductase [Bombilactobacillus thymidiniphilus]
MDAKTALITRRSTRQFTNQQIPQDDLIEIVKIAQHAPSWVSSQPQKVHIATGQHLKAIRQAHQKALKQQKEAQPDLPTLPSKQWPATTQPHMQHWFNEVKNTLGDDWSNTFDDHRQILFNAQAIVYMTLPRKYSQWSLYDLGAFGEALLTAAQAKKIASLPAYQFVCYPDILRQELSFESDEQIIMGIGLGYRDEKAPINQIIAERLPLEDFLTIQD